MSNIITLYKIIYEKNEIDIFSETIEKFYKYINKNYNFLDKEFISWINILKSNTNKVIKNYSNYSSFLLMGDVQSGKTNNLIYIAINLFLQKKIDVIIYLSGGTNDLLSQNQCRFVDTFKVIMPEIKIQINNGIDNITLDFYLRNSVKFIITSLKIKLRLQQIKDFVDAFTNINFLIIDDECDSFSLAKDSSKILNSILDKTNVKFLSVTATPFENLSSDIIKYDYFQVLANFASYTGINDFKKNLFIIDNEKKAILNGYLSWLFITQKNHLKDSQLLLNLDYLNQEHRNCYDLLTKIIKKIQTIESLKKITNEFIPEYNLLENDLLNMFTIHSSIFNNKIKIINSDDLKNTHENEGLEIIIGGYKLSRGITYKNLIVEVLHISNNKIKASTLLQKSRWFGYRKTIISEMKIILNDYAYCALEECEEVITLTKNYHLNYKNYQLLIKGKNFKYIKIQ